MSTSTADKLAAKNFIRWANTVRAAIAAALIENEEQARLLGMSAERECALRGKVDRLERELAAAQDEIAQLGREQYAAERELDAARQELAAAQGEVKRLTKQIKDDNRSYGCELRDPNGTIWEQATKDHDRAEKAERELAALRERYEYAEISLPAELIPKKHKEAK